MKSKHYVHQIEKTIAGIRYPSKPAELYEPIRYALAAGGKRMRPVIAMMACELFEGKAEDMLYPALGIELLHNFSLIHDDIMDQAPLRRGRETVCRRWNPNIAILSGDTLFAMAYDSIAKTHPSKLADVLHLFNRIAIQICEGQQMDMNFEQTGNVRIEDYIEMIRLKTAVFFGGCMQIGAMLANAQPDQAALMYLYGENLGIAFQLQDDILDVFGSEEEFGKKPGGDIVANKKTFLYLKALELSDKKTAEKLKQLYSDQPDNPDEKIQTVLEIYTKYQIREHAERLMEYYYLEAIKSYDRVIADEYKKKEFGNFCLGMLRRNT